jgi:hypothetical protein
MKALVVAGSGLGAIAAAAVLAWMLVGGSPREEIYPGLKLLSPNGEYVVSFFGTGGGGAVGWSYQFVAVARAADAFDPSSHVLRMRRGYQVCLRWIRDGAVLVQYPDGAAVESRQETADLDGRVDVDFEPVASEGGLLKSDCTGEIATLHAAGGTWDVKQ